jgi:hypothetical protein
VGADGLRCGIIRRLISGDQPPTEWSRWNVSLRLAVSPAWRAEPLGVAQSDTQERSYCNSVDSGKGTGRCRKEETLMPERYDERIVETAVQARQGVTGHNVRYVLAFSTCAVIAAFVIIYFLFFR